MNNSTVLEVHAKKGKTQLPLPKLHLDFDEIHTEVSVFFRDTLLRETKFQSFLKERYVQPETHTSSGMNYQMVVLCITRAISEKGSLMKCYFLSSEMLSRDLTKCPKIFFEQELPLFFPYATFATHEEKKGSEKESLITLSVVIHEPRR